MQCSIGHAVEHPDFETIPRNFVKDLTAQEWLYRLFIPGLHKGRKFDLKYLRIRQKAKYVSAQNLEFQVFKMTDCCLNPS